MMDKYRWAGLSDRMCPVKHACRQSHTATKPQTGTARISLGPIIQWGYHHKWGHYIKLTALVWRLGNLGLHYIEHLHRCISIGWCCSAKGLVELVSRVLGLKTWPVSSTALQVYLVYENFRAGEKNQKLWKLCTQSHMDNDLQHARTLLQSTSDWWSL